MIDNDDLNRVTELWGSGVERWYSDMLVNLRRLCGPSSVSLRVEQNQDGALGGVLAVDPEEGKTAGLFRVAGKFLALNDGVDWTTVIHPLEDAYQIWASNLLLAAAFDHELPRFLPLMRLQVPQPMFDQLANACNRLAAKWYLEADESDAVLVPEDYIDDVDFLE